MPLVWETASGSEIEQGDLLPSCQVPLVNEEFPRVTKATVVTYDLIVITQTCDLAHDPPPFVNLLQFTSTKRFEEANPAFAKKGQWDQVRKGRRPGLYLLDAVPATDDLSVAIVVDFRQIFTLPHAYIARHADSVGPRWRLRSPHREHFSREFGNYFSRVALPE